MIIAWFVCSIAINSIANSISDILNSPKSFYLIWFVWIILFVLNIILIAFNYKRNLFDPPGLTYFKSTIYIFLAPFMKNKLDTSQESDTNIYQIENKLFEIIGKRKKREFPIDIVFFHLWILICIIISMSNIIPMVVIPKIPIWVIPIVLLIQFILFKNAIEKRWS
jgi:hypothetical protein